MSLARDIDRRLRDVGRAHRAGSVDGYSETSLEVLGVVVPEIRSLVAEVAGQTKRNPPRSVIQLARALVAQNTLEARQVAYELLGRRRDARALLGVRDVEGLGQGNDNWKSVDVFGCEVAGPCWRDGRLTDAATARWARSGDRWWRRTALVSTVPLNMKSRGGVGDARRTLAICTLCVEDRDDMVVKALSWALRILSTRDRAAVRAFVRAHERALAKRVVREVRNKLDQGRKNP